MIVDPKNQLSITSALASISKAANFTVTGIDLRDYVGDIAVVLNVGASTAGVTPTLDIAFTSGTASNGSDAAAFSPAIAATQFAAAGALQVISIEQRKCGRYLKIAGTLGGTSTPTFPVSIEIVGVKRSLP